ncbi:MAG: hypothetical protein ABWY20_18345, partial [Mycobacterium sp.]
ELVTAGDRTRELREAALSYKGNWRDIVLFVCTMLFTFIWWHVSHSRTNWLTIFVFMIVLSIISGLYALRGAIRALRHFLREQRRSRHASAG